MVHSLASLQLLSHLHHLRGLTTTPSYCQYFFATPLLPYGSMYEELKFSGNLDVRHTHDVVECAVNTFAHHVVCDSNRT
ncbi:hypothetical protein PAXRUDRAFT_766298, partial [Paxillus rubicundulus Ve08.2h10]